MEKRFKSQLQQSPSPFHLIGGRILSMEPERSRSGPSDSIRNFELPKPVKEGDECEVTIESIGSRGDGIAKIKGLIIFVSNVKKGDKVKVKITSVRSNFATAEVLKVSEKAEENAPAQQQEDKSEEAEEKDE